MVDIRSIPAGMLILDHINPFRPDIFVVAVAENLRGQGIGPGLVRHIQAMPAVNCLRAEARNPSAKGMLKKCRFRSNRYKSAVGFPYMYWSQGEGGA